VKFVEKIEKKWRFLRHEVALSDTSLLGFEVSARFWPNLAAANKGATMPRRRDLLVKGDTA
jgi:hypothetical protein